MSDTNDAGATPQETPGAEGAADFQVEFAAFLSHDFGDEGQDEQQEQSSEAAPAGDPPQDTSAPASTTPDPATVSANAETPAATTETPAETPAPATPAVDQADLAAMLGITQVAEPAAEAESTSSSTPTAEEPFAPFQPTFKLPPAMTSALFEAEDTETRSQALVNLLSSFGNTVLQVMEQRFAEHHAPKVLEAVAGGMQENRMRAAVNQDFYGAFPELETHKDVVQKAFKVIAARTKGQPYSEATRNAIGQLARATLTQAGIKLVEKKAPATAAVPKEVKKAPVGKAPGSGFDAGAARVGGTPTGQDDGPAQLVSELGEWT